MTEPPISVNSPYRKFVVMVCVALAYFLGAKLGLLLTIPPSYVSALLPSSGVAIAAFLLWGWPALAGVFFGALLTQFSIFSSAWLALILATAAVFQTLLAAFLLGRFISAPEKISTDRDALVFLLIAGPLACLLEPSIKAFALTSQGIIGSEQMMLHWFTDWVGNTLGVIIFAPLLLILFINNADNRLRRGPLSMTVLLLSISVTALLSYGQNLEQKRLQSQVREQLHATRFAIEQELRVIEEALYAIRQYYNGSDFVEANEFFRFTQPILKRHRAIQALEWIPRVAHEQRSKFISLMTQQGFSNFDFLEKSSDGSFTSASVREEYYPVYYLEPFAGNKSAHGFDLFSSPPRQEAIIEAVSSGKVTLSEPIQLAQDKTQQTAMLMLLGVYNYATEYRPAPYNQAKQQLSGLALAVLRIGDLTEQAIQPSNQGLFQYQILDKTSGITIYGADLEAHDLAQTGQLPLNNQTWTLVVQPTNLFLNQQLDWRVYLTLLSILITVALISILALYFTGKHAEVRLEVNSKTQQLQQALRITERANRAKTEFLANMSHEMRTPLNSIIGFTNRILQHDSSALSSRSHDGLRLVEKNGIQLLHLINDLLDIAKVEAGHLSVRPQVFNIEELTSDLQANFNDKALEKGLEWRVEILSKQALIVNLDRQRLQQIINNLLSNAFKYTSIGSVTLRVYCSGKFNEWLEVEVRDTGVGIDDKDMPRLFKKFERLHSIHNGIPGTGLGLALARKFTELMAGDIEVDSRVGEGSCFTLHLPRDLTEYLDKNT